MSKVFHNADADNDAAMTVIGLFFFENYKANKWQH